MKYFNRLSIIAVITLILTTENTSAQLIKINFFPYTTDIVMALVPASFGISLEQVFHQKNSFELNYDRYGRTNPSPAGGGYAGYRVNLEYSRYFGNKNLYEGFFISPHISYLKTTYPAGDEPSVQLKRGISRGLGGGAVIGYQWVVFKRMSLGIDIGSTYYRNRINLEMEDLTKYEFYDNHLDFHCNFSLGYIIGKVQ